MAREAYIVTVQFVIHPDEGVKTSTQACDWVSGLFTEQLKHEDKIVDWHYLQVGEQYLYPTAKIIELEKI
jgi:hypothetical protein